MASVIRVENLSKKYMIGRQKKERYVALRDVISNHAKTAWRRAILNPLQSLNLASLTQQFSNYTSEEFYALNDVSFDIKQGERLGIIGRNGAGKSTLLKILSRITEPTSGRVSIKGRVASLLEVGTGFHPELTGRENIYLNGAILGMGRKEIKRKFDEIVAFAEVEKFIDTPVKHYSSGMYVRLAFAVAAHLEPEILVVDEVLAVGDAQFQKKCLGKMQEVGKEGRTVLFVSHNMSAIKTLCTNAISLHGGKLRKSGPVLPVVEEYLNSGVHNQTEAAWPDPKKAPGNETFRLNLIKISAAEGGAESLSVRTPLKIEFNYTLLIKDALFYIGFHLKTISGDCIFVTGLPPTEIHRGTYRSVCYIPGNLLNSGTYTIHAYFVRDSRNVLFEIENPIVFEIHDVEREPGAWMGDYPGAVRPKFNWDTTVCTEVL